LIVVPASWDASSPTRSSSTASSPIVGFVDDRAAGDHSAIAACRCSTIAEASDIASRETVDHPMSLFRPAARGCWS
jgi:hypothetical protein